MRAEFLLSSQTHPVHLSPQHVAQSEGDRTIPSVPLFLKAIVSMLIQSKINPQESGILILFL